MWVGFDLWMDELHRLNPGLKEAVAEGRPYVPQSIKGDTAVTLMERCDMMQLRTEALRLANASMMGNAFLSEAVVVRAEKYFEFLSAGAPEKTKEHGE